MKNNDIPSYWQGAVQAIKNNEISQSEQKTILDELLKIVHGLNKNTSPLYRAKPVQKQPE